MPSRDDLGNIISNTCVCYLSAKTNMASTSVADVSLLLSGGTVPAGVAAAAAAAAAGGGQETAGDSLASIREDVTVDEVYKRDARPFGIGASGKVYRGVHIKEGVTYAVKEIICGNVTSKVIMPCLDATIARSVLWRVFSTPFVHAAARHTACLSLELVPLCCICS